jgi:plastocyanin
MRLKGRFRLSYANVIASIALFIALCGGTATAAKVVITGKNIKNNSVTSKDIKNYSLQAKDLKKGLLASAAAAPLTSAAFQASRDAGPSGVAPSQSYTAVASLSVAPGSYVVFAKADMQSDQQDSSRCRLSAEAALDESNRGLRANGTGEAHNLQLAHTFTQPGAVTLSCRTSSGNWSASDTKLLAIKVGSAQAQGVSG